jgi:hypothetical protein
MRLAHTTNVRQPQAGGILLFHACRTQTVRMRAQVLSTRAATSPTLVAETPARTGGLHTFLLPPGRQLPRGAGMGSCPRHTAFATTTLRVCNGRAGGAS